MKGQRQIIFPKDDHCYELNRVPSPQIHMLKPWARSVTIFGGKAFKEVFSLRLNEVLRVGPNPIGLESLQEEEEMPGVCVHRGKGPVRTQRKDSHRQTKERSPRRHQPCLHLDLGLPALEMCENKFPLFKPHRLWYFLMAA